MPRKRCLLFLFVNLIAMSDSNAMLSLKQVCHNTLPDSLMARCISVILEHNIDGGDLPEDIQNEIQKCKEQLNNFLTSVLNGQACTVNHREKHIYNLSCVPQLIQAGADLLTTNRNGQSALHVAAAKNNTALMQFLLERCPPENLQNFMHEQDCDGNTPLHCATENNALDSMQILIKAGANLCAPGKYERTPLHKAAESDLTESIQLLLKHGVDIDVLDEMGNTPLHLAARIDNAHAVECLLNHGAQPAIKNKDGETPLSFARLLIVSRSEALLNKN